MDIRNEHQQPGEILCLRQAKFVCRLDRIDCVAARIRESDDLGFGVLRLQQERREVRCAERMTNGTEDFPTRFLDDIGRVGLE